MTMAEPDLKDTMKEPEDLSATLADSHGSCDFLLLTKMEEQFDKHLNEVQEDVRKALAERNLWSSPHMTRRRRWRPRSRT